MLYGLGELARESLDSCGPSYCLVRPLDEAGMRRVLQQAHHSWACEMLGALKAEPALLVTPPSRQSEQDGGLLTASESLGAPSSETALLKLDAGWVVLSACNTAAGDGNTIGAEARSQAVGLPFRTPPLSLL